MTGSLGNACRRAVVVFGWALLSAGMASVSSPSIAQVGPPVKLAPIVPPPSGERPLESAPAQLPVPDVREQHRPAARIEVNSLSAIDSDSIGLLDESQGGFGVDLWQGTERALVERLLPGLAPVVRSRFVRDLMVRLLLSRATAPKGDSVGNGLLALRVDRLAALGDMKSAVGLLRVSSGCILI